jgi:hypothetical protein
LSSAASPDAHRADRIETDGTESLKPSYIARTLAMAERRLNGEPALYAGHGGGGGFER